MRASASSALWSGRLHGDDPFVRHRLGHLEQCDGKDSVGEAGLDLVAIDSLRHPEGASQDPVAALGDVDAFALDVGLRLSL